MVNLIAAIEVINKIIAVIEILRDCDGTVS